MDNHSLCNGADSFTELQSEQAAEFDPTQFQILLHKWIITKNISFSEFGTQQSLHLPEPPSTTADSIASDC